MQINLKRNNFVNLNENLTGDRTQTKNQREHREKSTNCPKKSKLCIEFTKISNSNKARGVSADEMLECPAKAEIENQSKTAKASKSKLIKVRF